jgi:hypothetical protein
MQGPNGVLLRSHDGIDLVLALFPVDFPRCGDGWYVWFGSMC